MQAIQLSGRNMKLSIIRGSLMHRKYLGEGKYITRIGGDILSKLIVRM